MLAKYAIPSMPILCAVAVFKLGMGGNSKHAINTAPFSQPGFEYEERESEMTNDRAVPTADSEDLPVPYAAASEFG